MKRAAEKQLIKDGDEDIEDISGEEGFKKADEQVLANRTIRGLPKRASTASIASTTSEASPVNGEKPKFGGFSGFGSMSNNSSFSFTPPVTASNSLASISSSPPSNGTFSSKNPVPSVSSTASNATKAFASFLSTSSSDTASTEPSQPKDSDDAEYNYYLTLRGLNVSFISAANKAFDSDPFTDLAELLGKYQELRGKAQKDYDSGKRTSTPKTQPSPFATTTSAMDVSTSSSFSSFTKPPALSFSMPTPPASFAGFPPPSSSGSFPASTVKSTSEPLAPFLPPKAPTSTEGTLPTAATAPSFGPPAASKSSFSLFGGPTASSAFGGTSSTKSSVPNFFSSSSSTNLFGSGSSSSNTDNKSATSAFAITAPPSQPDIFGKPSGGDDTSKVKQPSLFGGSSTPTTNFFGSPASSGSTMNPLGSFGSSATSTPKPASPFSGFGKTSPGGGSLGNPVGFGFGAPSSLKMDSPGGLPTLLFPGSSSKSANVSEADGDSESAPGDRAASQGSEGVETGGLATPSSHDEEGEGEEDEETVHTIRAKVYRMSTSTEGEAKWNELGIGMLRLKKHKETGTRRMLMRNTHSGKIMINFNLYTGLSPTQSKKSVQFIGHENGASKTFMIRTSTEGSAKELKEALAREVAFVRA